ncbi:Cof-type HAD-IIB family hydrolase [bacterium endosymbiont of Pedicinus badii]|uniref:Cof-type HAD-IIB family hydrolase n=1 Tax=bacterium endosymbiont of Pedicinus badii TaxID=1719126 RepID=UPI0009BC0B2A|nr:Cof-type HAD-IIB family hydrolase [bacterium endosymbiont of Pedicinus badii]OQM34088.1 hydrolase [bacterium endosymbiont of Pedicinus badii]
MFRIVVSDLDGTLLSKNHRIEIFTKKILQRVIKKGIHFIFATGRHHIDVKKIQNDLKIKTYMITSNGARIHDNFGNLIFSHDFEESIVRELASMFYKDKKISTNIFRDKEWFISKEEINRKDFFFESSFNYKIYKNGKLPNYLGVCKIYFTCHDPKYLLKIERFLKINLEDKINVSFSLPICLEIMPKGVCKGKSLKKVIKILGYQMKDCISFGDGMNDIEMLSSTGKGCIMKNGHKRLKEKLPHLEIIGTNEEQAVAKYLKKIFL